MQVQLDSMERSPKKSRQNQDNGKHLEGDFETDALQPLSSEQCPSNTSPSDLHHNIVPTKSAKNRKMVTTQNQTGQHWTWLKIALCVLIILILEVLTILGCINFYLIYSGSVVSELREENVKLHSTVNDLMKSINFTQQLELEMQANILEMMANQQLLQANILEMKENQQLLKSNNLEIKESQQLMQAKILEIKENQQLQQANISEIKENQQLQKANILEIKENQQLLQANILEMKDNQQLLKANNLEIKENQQLLQANISDMKKNQQLFLRCSNKLEELKSQQQQDTAELTSVTTLLRSNAETTRQQCGSFVEESKKYKETSVSMMNSMYQFSKQIAEASGRPAPDKSFYRINGAGSSFSNPILAALLTLSIFVFMFEQ